jgi:hypothetical protein
VALGQLGKDGLHPASHALRKHAGQVVLEGSDLEHEMGQEPACDPLVLGKKPGERVEPNSE